MAKILVINPIGTNYLDEITYAHLSKIITSNTELIVRSFKEGPPAIECEYDKQRVAPYVIEEVIKANREGFDAVIINCFDDPGLEAAREVSDILVLGIGETSITVALTLGFRIAIISTGFNSKNVYYKKAVELGIINRIAYTGGIDVSVLDIRKDMNKIMSMLTDEGLKAINEYGAEVIVLGCGGFIGIAEPLSKKLRVPVIDPSTVTVKIAETFISLGIKHSKVYLLDRLKYPYS